MDDKLITLAVLTYSKAQILKSVLENEGIEASIHNVNLIQPIISSGVRVRIKESDLPHALEIIESSAWLSSEVLKGKSAEPSSETPKVLIPVDFSSHSLKACDIGFGIAGQLHAEVALLHVYFSPIYIPSLEFDTDSYHVPVMEGASVKGMIDNVHKQLDALSKSIAGKIQSGEYPPVKFNCFLRDGVPEEEILHYARTEKPAIIVMGTRGESQKDLDLIGSVTAEVIERSPSFVYAIPENAPSKAFGDIRRIALFTSFDQRDLIAFDSLIRMFQDEKFEISFIHVNSHEEKRVWNEIKLAGIKEYFKKQYPQQKFSYSVIGEDDLSLNLDHFVREHDIDVICTTNYKRNIFARLFNPSIAKKMLFHSDTPLLIIK